MIASFVTIMPTRPAQRQTPAAERLAEMLAIRRQLSAEKVAAENASRRWSGDSVATRGARTAADDAGDRRAA
jgi:hypothetical protein